MAKMCEILFIIRKAEPQNYWLFIKPIKVLSRILLWQIHLPGVMVCMSLSPKYLCIISAQY